MASQAAQLGMQAGLAAMGMPMAGAAMPSSFNLAFDTSSKSSAAANTYGGGGFDGSGWAVNIGPGRESAQAVPSSYGYAADPFGMPSLVTSPIGMQATQSAGLTVGPGLLLVAGLVLVLALKRK